MLIAREKKRRLLRNGISPSGHDEAAVLKPKPPRKLCKLLINRQLLPPPHKIRTGTRELYVTVLPINLQSYTISI